MLKLYWSNLQKRKIEELKIRIKMLGGQINEGDEDKGEMEEDVKARLADPLKDFPDDIKYLNERQCKAKIGITNRFGGRMAEEKRWDERRMRACLGKLGPVARRCAMNDVLWGRFLKYGDSLTLDDVKRMVFFDIKRRELYPPDYRGTGEEPPPEEYLAALRAQGRLDAIYSELDRLSSKA